MIEMQNFSFSYTFLQRGQKVALSPYNTNHYQKIYQQTRKNEPPQILPLGQKDWLYAFDLYAPFFLPRLENEIFRDVLDLKPYLELAKRQDALDLINGTALCAAIHIC